jgi:hypothetical protein
MSEFVTLDSDGHEVPADENGKAIGTYDDLKPEQEEDSEDEPKKTVVVTEDIKPEQNFDDLPKDLDENALIIKTDSGWATFSPESVLDEEDILVIFLNGKANSFIPSKGARFFCRWKTATGEPRYESIYYPGFRYKQPNSEITVLGFIKVK